MDGIISAIESCLGEISKGFKRLLEGNSKLKNGSVDLGNATDILIEDFVYFLSKKQLTQSQLNRYQSADAPFEILINRIDLLKGVVLENLKPKLTLNEIETLIKSFEAFRNNIAKFFIKKQLENLAELSDSFFKKYLLFDGVLQCLKRIVDSLSKDDLSSYPLISPAECQFTRHLLYPEALMVCLKKDLCLYLHTTHQTIHHLANSLYAYYSKGLFVESYLILKNLKEEVLKFNNTLSELYFIAFSDKEYSFFSLCELLSRTKDQFITMIDIQNLKGLNSIYGEDTINKLIESAEEALNSFMRSNRETSTIIRGIVSNFYILSIDIDEELYKNIIRKISQILKSSFIINKQRIENIKYTIVGLKIEKDLNLKTKDIIKTLLFLKEKAKLEKDSTYLAITQKDKQEILSFLTEKYNEVFIETKLKNREVDVEFQPIYTTNDRSIYALEALGRIKDDDKLIPAGLFIDRVYKINRIETFDRLILQALIEKKDRIKLITDRLFVNASFNSLLNASYLNELKHLLDAFDLYVVIELTEQKFVGNIGIINDVYKRFKTVFAVDDFGAGYSSLKSVIDLAKTGGLKVLKIDGSLIKDIDKNKYTRKTVKIISNLSKELGLLTVAEFVDNESTLSFLKEAGIELCQGYLLSKPMPIEDLILNKTIKDKPNLNIFMA
ncbi:EAL domain-containing protein [Hippea sp. KM1]|uniref:EAL domain-containing protein n=1 Tax=Hippea sp. KM1 TaxID=944481 RepID=UPI00046D7149|nr:EAL domain-containing protein [Hippea sp. KM1]